MENGDYPLLGWRGYELHETSTSTERTLPSKTIKYCFARGVMLFFDFLQIVGGVMNFMKYTPHPAGRGLSKLKIENGKWQKKVCR